MYTVGELKEYLKDVPDDYEVVYERIEDAYFTEHGWKTIKCMERRHSMFSEFDIERQFINTYQAYQWPEHKILVITAHY